MMSNPNDYPSVAAYLDWAGAQGFSISRSTCDRFGQPLYQQVRITTPAKTCATLVFVEDEDRLMSTTVAHLDRRLGRKSYLFV